MNPNNNVAKNTRQFKNIQLAFTIAAIAAKEECECGCHYETEYLNDYMKMEHCILKRIFNAVKRYSINDSYWYLKKQLNLNLIKCFIINFKILIKFVI